MCGNVCPEVSLDLPDLYTGHPCKKSQNKVKFHTVVQVSLLSAEHKPVKQLLSFCGASQENLCTRRAVSSDSFICHLVFCTYNAQTGY